MDHVTTSCSFPPPQRQRLGPHQRRSPDVPRLVRPHVALRCTQSAPQGCHGLGFSVQLDRHRPCQPLPTPSRRPLAPPIAWPRTTRRTTAATPAARRSGQRRLTAATVPLRLAPPPPSLTHVRSAPWSLVSLVVASATTRATHAALLSVPFPTSETTAVAVAVEARALPPTFSSPLAPSRVVPRHVRSVRASSLATIGPDVTTTMFRLPSLPRVTAVLQSGTTTPSSTALTAARHFGHSNRQPRLDQHLDQKYRKAKAPVKLSLHSKAVAPPPFTSKCRKGVPWDSLALTAPATHVAYDSKVPDFCIGTMSANRALQPTPQGRTALSCSFSSGLCSTATTGSLVPQPSCICHW